MNAWSNHIRTGLSLSHGMSSTQQLEPQSSSELRGIMIFENFQKSLKINENPSKSIDSGSGHLSRVAARWSLERSERSSRRGGIDARGRRRRPGVQKHVRNVASSVPTDLHGDWRSPNRFSSRVPKPLLFLNKRPSGAAASLVTALT